MIWEEWDNNQRYRKTVNNWGSRAITKIKAIRFSSVIRLV